jgi:AraC family transcriptional regulator
MTLAQAQKQSDLNYPNSTVLRSSIDFGWSTMFAERRSFSAFAGPGSLAPHAEVTITLPSSEEGFVTCKVDGGWRTGRLIPGSIWCRGVGARSDEACVASRKWDVLHLYLPSAVFARLMDDYNLPSSAEASIRYSCAIQDEVINQIGLSVLSEMMCPTSSGRMLAETSSLLLAARLTHAHAEPELVRVPLRSRYGLDDGRLRRVLAYIEEHLGGDISVADLANVARLSIFHFTRAFTAAVGVPPHRYVSGRRLQGAKAMIAKRGASLSEIALECCFSSQSSFTRAFRRATGMTPAEYQRTLR